MNPTFKKLNYAGQPEIYVLNAPESFQGALDEMAHLASVHAAVDPDDTPHFLMTFATKQTEVDAFADLCAAQTQGDSVIWVCYPKGSSKRYKCEFNRDKGWDRLGAAGFEPVRQVAIDEDWSALRFRRVGFIKNMTRGGAISAAGKERIGQKDE